MPQFKAEAGKDYYNPATGQTVNFSAEQLKNEAIGMLSSQFTEGSKPADFSSPQEMTFEQPTTPTTTPSVSPSVGSQDWLQDFVGKAVADHEPIKPVGMDDERTRIETEKRERINALDEQYAVNLEKLRKQNKDTSNALKARLFRRGISESDSAWSNAEAGQIERDRESESALYSEYLSNKAAISADVGARLTNLATMENQQQFEAQVQNMNAMLTKANMGINLYQIFAARDDAEKDREQSAYQFLMNYQYQMFTLDQNSKQFAAQNFLTLAKDGYFNVSDTNTMEMLANLEQGNPDYLTGLSKIATQGLTDRLSEMQSRELDNEYKKTQIQNLKTSAANAAAAAANAAKQAGADAQVKARADFFADIEKQVSLLSAGDTKWATAFNFIMAKHGPDTTGLSEADKNAVLQDSWDKLDALLGKDLWDNKKDVQL